MKKIFVLVVVALIAVSGTITVLASPRSGVSSSPALFSVIKTDSSNNNNVEVIDNKMVFTPGKGVEGKMFGFQPGSRYYYEDLIRVQNSSHDNIYIWYTLDGELADLYTDGVFWLDAGGASHSKWEQFVYGANSEVNSYQVIQLAGNGSTGAIGFYFDIPVGQETKSYRGNIVFHGGLNNPMIKE